MTCYCPDCSDDPKPTWTEAFKIECLAKVIAEFGEKKRVEWYGIFRTKNGDDFARRLITQVNNQRRKNANK